MHPYLFPGLNVGPQALAKIMKALPAEAIDRPTHPDRFTPREVIAHMADWEPIFQERIKAGVDNPGAQIIGIDEVQRAVDMNYAATDWQDQANRFIVERAKTIGYLNSLMPEDWAKTTIHNEKGPLTIYDHANMLVGHDMYHVEQLMDVFLGTHP